MYTELAQQTIHKILSTINESDGSQIDDVIQASLRDLVVGLRVDQGLIWLVVGTQLTVKGFYANHSMHEVLLGQTLSTESSALISLNFLTNDDASVVVNQHSNDDWGPLLSVTKSFESQLIAPLKGRGLLPGFITLQSTNECSWSSEQRATLEQVASLLSVVISYDYALQRYKIPLDYTKACSFCGVRKEEFEIVTGASTSICTDCLRLCTEILGDASARLVKDTDRRCSFCNRGPDRVEKIIQGPGVLICNECINLAGEAASDR